MTTGWKRAYPTCALSMRIEAWLERKVIEKADLLLFNVERLRNAYRERYAHVPGERFVFIPNGIAPGALEETAEAAKYERFTLSYTGTLYVGRSPEPVFEAVSRLIRKGKAAPEAIRIKLVGQCRMVDGVPTASLICQHGLESSGSLRSRSLRRGDGDHPPKPSCAPAGTPSCPFRFPPKPTTISGPG